MLRFDRIEHLISPDDLRDKVVVQVGVGSGGAPVNEHLTMNGVRKWVLFDPDTYDEVNLIKHPRLRADLGTSKVDLQKKWILDRNPGAEVEALAEDVLTSPRFRETVKTADVVLCCADTQAARLFVNDTAVEMRRPCVTASVYRQGFGGEVYGYNPGGWACFNCMLRVAEKKGWNIQDTAALLPVEKDAIYGLNQRDFKASGLSMDIQTIALIQARMALDILMTNSARRVPPIPANWIIFYNRPIPNNAESGFLKRLMFKVTPQKGCPCKD